VFDLSFKRVYRDFGPLDSIIQVAGRCNRHNEYGELGGEMFLLNLKEGDKILSNYVYDKYILQQTEALLRKFQDITSNQFEELVKSIL
jgi:CRISPR-associated endonuclease/helicase Cas3